LGWAIVCAATAGQLVSLSVAPSSNDAERTAAYINSSIPPDAVVETWEWELSGLSQHRAFHHPSQHYLFLAMRQHFHEGVPFSLDYDLLQADPDYLIVGPLSVWIQIYPPETISAAFTPAERIGAYSIYKRLRP
jgi:hypothetical protein